MRAIKRKLAAKASADKAGILANLTILQKLLILVLMSALPIATLGHAVFRQMQHDIEKAAFESRGTRYLDAVWNVLSDTASGRPANPQTASKRLAGFKQAQIEHDPIFQTQDASKTFVEAVEQGKSATEIFQAGQLLIQKIGDQSTLFLDPVFQSVYLMDAAVWRIPEFVSASMGAREAAVLLAQSDTYSNDKGQSDSINNVEAADERFRKVAASLVLVSGRMNGAFDTTVADIEASNSFKEDSASSKALDEKFATFKEAATSYRDLVSEIGMTAFRREPLSKSVTLVLHEGYMDLAEATDMFWREANSDLRAIIDQRHAKLVRQAVMRSAVALVSLFMMALIAALIVWSVRNPLVILVKLMDRVRKNDVSFHTPYLNQTNEIGNIARALEQSRQSTLQLGSAQFALEAKLQEEGHRNTETQQLLSDVSRVVAAAQRGDFSQRVSASRTSSQLSSGLNDVLQIVERSIVQTGEILGELAQGKVSRRISGIQDGLFGKLANDVNKLSAQMELISGQLGTSTSAVHRVTQDISTGVSNLSVRTEQQAVSLEETATSAEQLSATIKHNAENARHASQMAATAWQRASSSGEVSIEAMASMERIEKVSGRVAEIATLIQEFAFQTNILSLNAAVEAARAGEAGKGFAVVASEVRSLSHRVGEASKNIKALIAETDQSVKQGTNLVRETHVAFSEIVHSVGSINKIVSEIAEASSQQSISIDQFSRTIAELDMITQENAALVGATDEALRSAQSEVSGLNQAMAFFRTSANPRLRRAS